MGNVVGFRRPGRSRRWLMPTATLIGAAVLGAVIGLAPSCSTDRPEQATGPLIAGTVTQVHDGDTMRIGATRIRLAAIDANELGGRCHHACAAMSATAARDNLARLALGHRVECEQTGTSYKRVVAFCRVGEIDLSCAQVRAGAAIIWDRYDPHGAFRRRCLGRG